MSKKSQLSALLEQSNQDPFKTTKQARDAEKDRVATQQALYGAGQNGWTKQWYKQIVEAYKDDTLTITGNHSDVNLLLAEHKPEENLNDNERMLLMIFAHPQWNTKKQKDPDTFDFI